MTKREMFDAIKAVVIDNAEMVEFLDNEIALIDKKSANRKPTAKQKENIALKAEILATLAEADEPMTVKDVWNATDALIEIEDMTGQRVARLLTDLVKDEKVTRTVVKRVPHFELATGGNGE